MRTLGRCDSPLEGRNVTDEVCLGRLREGDLHGFEPIYSRHHAHAESVARTLAGSCAVRDLTSEAFARLAVLVLDGRGPETDIRNFLTGSISAVFHERVTQVVRRARATGKVSVFAGMVRAAAGATDAPAATVQLLPENWRLLLRDVALDHLRRAFVDELEQRVTAALGTGRILRLADKPAHGERDSDGACRSAEILLHLTESPVHSSAAEGAGRTAGRGRFRVGPSDQGGGCSDPLGA